MLSGTSRSQEIEQDKIITFTIIYSSILPSPYPKYRKKKHIINYTPV